VTGRWWFATSADILRVERETPTVEELGRRAGEAVAADQRYQEQVREMVEGLKRPR